MRVAWAALVSMLVLVAAGCGGEDVGVGETSGAELLKPGALVYWETVSDPDSDQWQQVEDLLKRFPDGERWIAELRREIESDGKVTWERDIKPALGDRAVVAVYARSTTDVSFVGMTNPEDPNKTIALVEKLNETDEGDDAVTRVVDDWVLIFDKEASIDAALKGDSGQALADAEGFKSALEELPDDALTRVYFDPAAAMDALANLDPESGQAFRMLGLDGLDFAGAWAKAKDDGAEIAAALSGEGADRLLGTGDPYSSKLLDRVPADAFAFYSFRGDGVKRQLERFQGNPLYAMGLREFENELGVKVADLVGLFEGEVAFFARQAAPIPELTLLLDAANPTEARQSAARLLTTLAERAGGEVTQDGDITTAIFEGFTVNLGSAEGLIVLTTSKDAIADVRGDGERLGDADRYKDALEAAGAPDEYTGLMYVDLTEAIDLIMGFASSSGEDVPAEVRRNLEPLRSIVAFGEEDGSLSSSLVFLEIAE
jgi:hypothetical protein